MLSLIVKDLTGTQHVLELYTNEPVRLTYQAQDTKDISRVTGSYSQTFRVPSTESNKAFFGGFAEPGIHTPSDGSINGKFSVKKKVEALLVQDTIPIMTGYVQVKGVVIMGGRTADYQVTFFGETPAFATELSGKLLSDLTTSGIDQDLTYGNIRNSWTGTDADDFNVIWGLFEKGQGIDWSTTGGQNVLQSDMVPYVSLHWIWNRIFTEAGFSYTSTFIDDNAGDFKKMYMPAWEGSISPKGDETPEDEIAGAGMVAPQSITSFPAYTQVLLQDTATGGYDPGGNWSNTAYEYTVPYSGFYTIQVSCGMNASFTMRVTIDGAELNGTNRTQGLDETTFTFTQNLQQGEKVALEVRRHLSTSPNFTITPGSVGQTAFGTAYMQILEVSDPISGHEVQMNRNFPEMKQLDFVTSLQKMFNLVMYPDKDKPKHLIVEPYSVWSTQGSLDDWTSKLDLSKDIVLTPTMESQSQKYKWRYSPGQDLLNKGIEDQLGRGYAEKEVLDPENDFAKGETEVRTGFVPHVSSTIPNSVAPIFKGIDQEGVAIKKPQPTVAFWNGTGTNGQPDLGVWNLYSDAFTAQPQTNTPVFTMYSDFPATVTDSSLEYAPDFAFHPQTAFPLNNLYYKYWSAYANELYSADGRFMEAFFYLTPKDLSSFSYNDKILVENQLWRVQKISGYDPTSGSSCKVVLKLILDDIRDCAFIPSSVTSSGGIRFTNAAGQGNQLGNQKCCERYGYTYLVRKTGTNECVQPTIQLEV